MDWKIFLTVFGTVFLAELGDKTQLATLVFSTQSRSPVLVFIAAAGALVLASLLAVIVGQGLAQVVPERAMKGIAGAAFIVIGALLIGSVIRQ